MKIADDVRQLDKTTSVKEKIDDPKEIINEEVKVANEKLDDKEVKNEQVKEKEAPTVVDVKEKQTNDESNGVGDKIKKFEKAAEDATTTGTVSRGRPGSARSRTRPDTSDLKKPEPLKIIKPEFKPPPSGIDVTIRSPSLGAKIGDQFPSQGTAFRNVASSPPNNDNNHRPTEPQKLNDDVNTQNNVKACKFKDKKYSVSKGSSYYTRGPEEIWLVKKKDIEEIEERVLDSFRRAGGATAAHTLGRPGKRQYLRSESLDPQWACARAHTLKRQTSVACTCAHDKKPRARTCDPPRPRSKSHGYDNTQSHVLDKYETLV